MPAASCGLPGSSGGPPSNAPCLTLLRVGFTEPPGSPRALVVSYTTVSPLPGAEAPGGLFSVALSRGSPRVGVTHHPALWSPDFPRRSPRAPTRPPGRLVQVRFYAPTISPSRRITQAWRPFGRDQGGPDDAGVVEQAGGHDRCTQLQQRQELVRLLAHTTADDEQVRGEDELEMGVEASGGARPTPPTTGPSPHGPMRPPASRRPCNQARDVRTRCWAVGLRRAAPRSRCPFRGW